MSFSFNNDSATGLEMHGIENPGRVFWNLSTPRLYEEAIKQQEGHLAHLGLVVRTGHHTGRSPLDRFLVEGAFERRADLVGDVNKPISQEHYDLLKHQMLAYLQGGLSLSRTAMSERTLPTGSGFILQALVFRRRRDRWHPL